MINVSDKENEMSEHLYLLLNRITDSIFSLDNEWNFTYANDSSLSLFKKSKTDIIGNSIENVFPDIIGTLIWEKIHESKSKQNPLEFESFYEPLCIWLKVRCFPSSDGLTLIYQNISESKNIERKVRETTNLLNTIVENIPNMIFLKHASDLRFVLFNRAGESLLGYNRDDLFGKNDYDFFPKEQADFFTEKDRFVLSQKGILEIKEENIDTPQGTRILNTKKLPLFDENGNAQYLLGISEDITDKKDAEKKIKESEEQFRTMFENHNAVMLLIDPDNGKILEANIAAGKYYGYTETELTSMYISQINSLSEEEIAIERANAVEQRRNYFKFIHKLSSGEERFVEVHSSPIYMKGKNVLFSIVHDITERKLAEEKINSLLAEKSLLLQEVHHRIKNNMMTLSGFLFLQTETLKDSEAIASLNDANSRIQSMIVLYDKLYRSPEFTEISALAYISPLIDEIINNFPNSSIVKTEKHIEDYTLTSTVLFPVGIILNEVITNSMKYAFQKRTEGKISFIAKRIPENKFLFSIQDDGPGISKITMKKTSSSFGFQLIKLLSQQLKAKFQFENQNGAKFTLIIPI